MNLLINKKWLLVTVAATLLLSGCSGIEQSIHDTIDTSVESLNKTKAENQPVSAEFIRHVDGDTTLLRIDGKEQKVRFLLIDAPETVKVRP